MKKISKLVFITILLSLFLTLFAGFGNNFASAQQSNQTVDLTKIHHGHYKIYDWKEGNDQTDRTNATFDTLGGDELDCVLLYGSDEIPILVLNTARDPKGYNDSRGAFWFNPAFNNDPPGDHPCLANCDVDLGNQWVLTDEAKDFIMKNAQSKADKCKLALYLTKGWEGVNLSKPDKTFYNKCDDILKVLQHAPAGIYKLQPFGKEGDSTINPFDTFNKFELAQALVFDLSDPNKPEVRGINKDGSEMKITDKDKIYAKEPCQDVKNTNDPNDIIYTIVAGKGGGLDAVMQWILSKVSTVINAIISAISGIVKTYAIINTDNFFTPTFRGIWISIRDICNILFVLVLLGIAFMNFLGEGIDAYTIKKLLPRFLIAIIIINFSLLMCKIIVDFSNVLSQTFAGIGDYKTIVTEQTSAVSAGIAGAEIGAAIVALVLAIIGVIAGLLLAFLLIFRVVMIWLLVMLSPFVFLLWILPPTQQLFNKWWDQFIKYVFMGPVVVLILALAKRVSISIPTGDDPAATTWIKLLFSSGMIIAAAFVPLALGGMAMQKVAGAIKSVGKKTWGATGAKAVAAGAARAKEGYMARVGEKRGLIGKIPRSERARAKARAEVSRVREPIYDERDDNKLAKLANKGDVMAAKALIRHGKTDLLDSKMLAKSPGLQQMAKQYDPIGAGLQGDALKTFLNTADASNFNEAGVKKLLEQGNLSDHHIQAIATRGNQAGINALHEHFAKSENQDALKGLDRTTQNAVMHSALSSKDTASGIKLIQSMQKRGNLSSYLQHASANQAIEWQNSGVIQNIIEEAKKGDQGSIDSLESMRKWGGTNRNSLETLVNKGEISQDFFNQIT